MASQLPQLLSALFLGLTSYFGTAGVAVADTVTSIIKTATAPVTLTACHAADYDTVLPYMAFPVHVNVVNRTRYDMISVTIAYRAFDTSNEQIGQATDVLSPAELLRPADTGTYGASVGMGLSEPSNTVGRLTCRVVAATFTGRKTWSYDHRWPEKLLPMDSSGAGGEKGRAAGSSGAGGSLSERRPITALVTVVNAWNDPVNGALFVHDTVAITGGNSDITVAPGSFILAIQLANGGRKSYRGLSTAAPSYSKYNVTANNGAGGNVLVPEVAADSDLGRMGSITVPAHGTVTVTVTFAVTDPVADPNANRGVTLR